MYDAQLDMPIDARVRSALLTGLVAAVASIAAAQPPPDFQITRAPERPIIDGVLDDAAWTREPLAAGQWISYNPLRGDQARDRTDVRVAYDDRFIYFSFHCWDSEPAKVRTTLSRRDSAFSDDWVGVSLDSTGTGQTAYHLFVNPSGVQMDAVNTASSGERFENDLVWESGGRRTADGYTIEIALPLQTIRFRGDGSPRMGILFWRHISRAGVSYSWPDMPPGQWVFNRHAHLVFPDLKPRRLAELLPSATFPISQTRAEPRRWNGVEGTPAIGLSAKYGLTSEITLDTTVNPDFSQVESDAFQVQVNQRFPTFFSEKRPFFMEGLGLFNLAASGEGNMRIAVHTRRIIDPQWGTKVTGTERRFTFGALNAIDENPEDVGDRGDAVAGRRKLFTIGRATYGFGESSYVGTIVTDTEHASRSNRVAGGDFIWKATDSQQISGTALYSQTRVPSVRDASGGAAFASYQYDTRRLFVNAVVEHFEPGFQMDTAFYNRTGITSGFVFADLSFYPEAGKRFGLIRVHPFIVTRRGRDRIERGDEYAVVPGVRFNFNRQGFLNIEHDRSREPFRGRRFDTGSDIRMFGNVQLFRWLHLFSHFQKGSATFYDEVDPYQGRQNKGGFEVTWQPTVHFNQSVGYDTVRFRRAETGASVFNVHIINSKSIYQFNKHFLVRLLEQFDSSDHRLLTDLLASYEFVPGTVVHAGYGSIYERQAFENGRFVPNQGDYLTVSRGLFFKASYLYRF